MSATIKKMQIQGIRSFDPDHPETIEFYNPLTMIIGANGCGKTTIIECLKFMTTGGLPPGVGKGHSFISDPTITDSTTIKASIRLRLEDAEGHGRVRCVARYVVPDWRAPRRVSITVSDDQKQHAPYSVECGGAGKASGVRVSACDQHANEERQVDVGRTASIINAPR